MKVVGVTSCIAGLAHTPMAAKALEKAGVKLGHDVKIEQQGAMGTIDEITPAEVSAADVVIIAADKVIDGEDRFKGKPVVRVKIGQCVANGEAVLSKVVAAIEARKQKEAN
ncbi:PTS fructose transporter subunit IIB [Listeria monocytogenes]|jgi:PTS system, fructose-specific, IIB component|uniref:Lmo0399 protein n=15 Tax=Listeria TaxID=1637 RepID=Q92EN6_LISMO|nr:MULTISPECIES: PTS fructose transporter subunit IIB [Listeria]NP_463929.1 PTS fructose transporter subunit IIB [Listeria monocytogenes EGD-e]EAA0164312.1 PTS fructose transporter subunit IIB [Listeria monocytogenes serotype 1/2a]EAD3236655.1 PTS fructose transporter subunit IIB [Listeria monocytogenes CFSAN002202]EAE3702232.1 PTS fructose transporter subunit IIB [Listeria monocytogenes serotype 1/2c]EAE6022821.1 PTS fructose transporter subunit IIB [Listeria monocytogenes serotype 3a]EAF450